MKNWIDLASDDRQTEIGIDIHTYIHTACHGELTSSLLPLFLVHPNRKLSRRPRTTTPQTACRYSVTDSPASPPTPWIDIFLFFSDDVCKCLELQEAGVARFDVIQEKEDPTKFCLVEVYTNGDAPAKHKETDHYLTWRDAVKDMMAVPRTNTKYKNYFPKTESSWRS